jgi:hypothetical protein
MREREREDEREWGSHSDCESTTGFTFVALEFISLFFLFIYLFFSFFISMGVQQPTGGRKIKERRKRKRKRSPYENLILYALMVATKRVAYD